MPDPRSHHPALRPARRWAHLVGGRRGSTWPWWLGGIYLAISAGWILGSDSLVAGLGLSAEAVQRAQSAKGLGFVLFTSLLLVVLSRRGVRSLSRERDGVRLQAAALEETASAVVLADERWAVTWTNPAFTRLTGYTAAEAVGQRLDDLLWGPGDAPARRGLAEALEGGETFRSRTVHRRKDGTSYVGELSVAPVHDERGRVVDYVAVQEDVSEAMALAERLRFLASFDPLTELPNRALFLERVAGMARTAVEGGGQVVLLVGRIDRIHRVRQSLGRDTADDLVRGVAGRLRAAVGEGPEMAAFGGGLFAFAWPADGARQREVAALVERLLEEVGRPMAVGGSELYPQVTFGCSLHPRDAASVDEALLRAETALSLAIEEQRPLRFFEDHLQTSIADRVALETELRGALARSELFVEYQLVFDLASGHPAFVEALVRWRHPRHGVLSPGRFLAVAEAVGLGPRVDHWVLARAVADQDGPCADVVGTVAVNLGPRTFNDEHLLTYLDGLVRSTGLEPYRVVLEITERDAMQDPERAVKVLEQLRGRGFLIAIDDFGVAYSSLNYLRRLPAHFLKIDRSFVGGLGAVRNDERLIEAVLSLADDYGMEVIAEGVEELSQLDWLRRHGCRYGQGFLLARPAPVVELAELAARGLAEVVSVELEAGGRGPLRAAQPRRA